MLKYLGTLKREYHHIKAVDDSIDKPRYEGCMVILRDDLPGRSFMIPQSAAWKYIDPKDNLDARAWDFEEFNKIATKTYFKKMCYAHKASEWADDAAAIIMAEQMAANSGFLLTLGYNLVKCCQMFGITVSGPALAQLLMFIQDGLTQLRTMRLHIPEATEEIGEMAITLNDKTVHQALEVSESEMVGVL